MQRGKHGRRAGLCLLLLVSLALLASCGKTKVPDTVELPTFVPMVSPDLYVGPVETIENPVDFVSWWDQDKNVYAYLEIPGTIISYPVFQSSADMPED